VSVPGGTISRLILEMDGVAVRYPGGTAPVVSGVHLSLQGGQRLALLGLNGSGKTTLLLAPVGLLPVEGRITVTGLDLGRSTLAEIRRRTGFLFAVPEDQLLFPRALDDVLFSLERRGLSGEEARRKASAMLDRLGIAHLADRNPHSLSHGERTRVALAGALVGDTELLLLDEPSAALDPPARLDLARLLADLPTAMVVATHDLEFARSVATHFTLLENGCLRHGARPIAELPGDQNRIWPVTNSAP